MNAKAVRALAILTARPPASAGREPPAPPVATRSGFDGGAREGPLTPSRDPVADHDRLLLAVLLPRRIDRDARGRWRSIG
jgi:hypothetical protein